MLQGCSRTSRTSRTSGCDGCEPNGACQDYVLQDDIIFPAYKNTEYNKCLNRESMLNVIRYRMADGFSRDPATKARLNLPEDLANLIIDPPAADEEEEWPQYEQNIFEDDETEMHPYDEADDAMFDIGYMARSIRAGDPAHAVMVYHTTKHHVTDFDPVMITKLWELGMHVEAKDLYERTLQFVASDGMYSFTSIAVLWNAGMEDQAWQLHILKARWLPEGYPAGMINHYLQLHMHKLAQSLHDRTISVLYDGVDDDIYDIDEVVVCIVAMTAFGMKDQARELYEFTLKVEEDFDWKIILKLKECGMEMEAAALFERTYTMAKVLDARGIVELYKAGFKQQAEDLYAYTFDKGTWYDWPAIIEMNEIGMRFR